MRCVVCNEYKEIHGREMCRQCYMKWYYRRNKEKISKYKKELREQNIDRERARHRKYYWDNRNAQLERCAKYYKENMEQIRARRKIKRQAEEK